ncbi:MAG TPA: helix-turn-helix transcriptional regulator [Prevotella sp.]|nr:helix-turn-helix transcriptional regulator [uncultured Prevotella sp.]HRM58085.1 helix-turn-helix transcriptional regulator [Prevotella sp.]
MKTNKIMDSIRNTTPTETNKQVDFCVAIANRIFDVMTELGMKQRDLAKALGKTETEVSRWLSGTHNLTIATIAKIAAVLGDDIITTTTSTHPYKLPEEQYVAMAAEDIHKH